MTKQELQEKGITLKNVTAMMNRYEKLIAYFNNKYEYNIENASEKEAKEWRSALNVWDRAKITRDTLNKPEA